MRATADPVQFVLDRLDGVTKTSGGWAARCPAHNDTHASLTVSAGEDGRALFRCHAGCSLKSIVDALGITVSDLFSPGRRNGSAAGNGHQRPSTQTPAREPKSYATLHELVTAGERVTKGKSVGHWQYSPTFGVLRFNLSDGSKEFRPYHRAKGGLRFGDPPGPLPLYKLDELAGAKKVYVLEGEKCADAARRIGLAATTSSHGAKAADKSDWTPLATAGEVIILPDNDDAGRQYARDVERILFKQNHAARVKVVALPGLDVGGDLCNWLEEWDSSEPEQLREAIAAFERGVRPADPADVVGGAVLVCLADVEPKATEWLWKNKIPLGAPTLGVGPPGAGKGHVMADFTARITTGTPWPDGTDCPLGSVILALAEDDLARTTRPRLDAAGGDPGRVHVIRCVRRVGEDGEPTELQFTLHHVRELERTLQRVTDCKAVIIDPLGSFLGERVDAHRDNEVRAVLSPIAALAEKYNVAVFMVAHRRKGKGGSADESALGSRAFSGVARAVHHFSRDPRDKHRRYMLPGKNNLAPEGGGLAFTLVGEPIAAVSWEATPVNMTADEAFAAERDEENHAGRSGARKDRAIEWLQDLLADGRKPVPEIQQAAKAAGLSWTGSVRRAREELGIKPVPGGFGAPWYWELPAEGHQN